MSEGQQCPCGASTAGTALCSSCRHRLEVVLADLSVYLGDLDTVRAKQTRYTGAAGGTGARREIPLPIDPRFLDPGQDHYHLERDTAATLGAWAATVAPEVATGLDPTGCCRLLLTQVPRITGADYAAQLLDELTDLERRWVRVVDRPPDRWYAGVCSAPAGDNGQGCTAELYARTDRGTITCPSCATTHDVAARREFLLNEAESMLVTATEAARAITVWSDYGRGENRLMRRIMTWRDRGRITTRGHVSELGTDRPLYRLGDVLDLLAADATTRSGPLTSDKTA